MSDEMTGWAPQEGDIKFIQDLIDSPKDVWGIPATGVADRPETYLQYYINREKKAFRRIQDGLGDPGNIHLKTKAILEKLGWSMLERDTTMMDPINPFLMQVMLTYPQKEVINDLGKVLRGTIPWRKAVLAEEETKDPSAGFWQATVGDWNLAMVDLYIGDQPGREKWEHGQNITLSNMKSGLVLLSDGILFHQLAAWLNRKREQAVRAEYGTGKTKAAGQTLKDRYERQPND